MFKRFRAPHFWYDKSHWGSKILQPCAALFRLYSNFKRNSITAEQSSVPVVCVGNVVFGGAGKTPTVAVLTEMLKKSGFNPHVLTSSSGGYLNNVLQVNPELHSYLQVGDEALLTALVVPTWIGKNRVKASKAAISAGADVLIMDDGFQNNALIKDFRVLVVDANQQFGNEYLLPAGPLIEPVNSGINASDVVLIIGDKNDELEARIRLVKEDISICYAHMEIAPGQDFENKKVLAFCGLAYPQKFLKTLKENDFEVIDFIQFADQHAYTIIELHKLITRAKENGADLITTRKDAVKVPEIFKRDLKILDIKLVMETTDLEKMLVEKIEK